MKRVIRLTESELHGIIKKVLKEQEDADSVDVRNKLAADQDVQYKNWTAQQKDAKTTQQPINYKKPQTNYVEKSQVPKLGDMGPEVTKLQQSLQLWGGSVGMKPEAILGTAGVDGYFGPKTAEAIRLFKEKNNIQPITAQLDPTTLNKIHLHAKTWMPGTNLQIASGRAPINPKVVQQKLIDLGFSVGNAGADGIIGPETRKAIRAFQSKNGIIPANGQLDKITISKLLPQPIPTKGTNTRPVASTKSVASTKPPTGGLSLKNSFM